MPWWHGSVRFERRSGRKRRRIGTPRPPGASAHRTTEARVAMPVLRSPAQTRANITARCTELVSQRDDLDPAGSAYESKSLQIDAALSALWALGPAEV